MKAFDKVYLHYDKFMNFFNLYKLDEIKEALQLKGKEIVVDIGGGTGELAKYLSDKCQKVYVLDESEKMLSKVKKSEKIIPVLENALDTEFQPNSIDVVILSDVLHHIENQTKLIDEISRILKNNGKLLIMDFEKRHLKTKLLSFFESILFGRLKFKTKKEVLNLLQEKFIISNVFDYKYYFIIIGEKNDK